MIVVQKEFVELPLSNFQGTDINIHTVLLMLPSHQVWYSIVYLYYFSVPTKSEVKWNFVEQKFGPFCFKCKS